MRGLTPAAGSLLACVDAQPFVRTQELPTSAGGAKSALELERRLLVHSGEIHTASGAHAKGLRSWSAWSRGCQDLERLELPAARATLEACVAELPGGGRLPWPSSRT